MEYSTIKDTAMVLGVTERWLQMLCKQGKISGATRFNNQGAWMIPSIWVEIEKKKRFDALNLNKGECDMMKLAFVFDDVSKEMSKDILNNLEKDGIKFSSIGMIPIYAHEKEDDIVSSLYKLIHNSEIVLGISSSGNGIAIYTNKISGFTAAPVVSIEDVNEAIDIYHANAFDIPAHNVDSISICKYIIERVGKTNEME